MGHNSVRRGMKSDDWAAHHFPYMLLRGREDHDSITSWGVWTMVPRTTLSRMIGLLTGLVLSVPLILGTVVGPAQADTAPPGNPLTVSTQALPTAQIGTGVVW